MLIAGCSGILKWRSIDRAARMLAVLVCVTFCFELSALIAALVWGNNMPVYHVFSPVQLCLLIAYFSRLFQRHILRRLFPIFVSLIILLAVANTLWVQLWSGLNSYFLLFESVVIVAFCIYAFFVFFSASGELHLLSYPHFWIVSTLFAFWCLTFSYWGLFRYLSIYFPSFLYRIYLLVSVVNTITYFSFAIIFLKGNYDERNRF